jgi:hypothetical protein
MAYTAPEIDLSAPAGVLPAGSSYLDPVDASAYFANTFNAAAWNAIPAPEQTIALAEATKWLDTLCWYGDKCDPAQAMSWPRKIDATNCCDAATCTTLPPAMIQAVAELALALHRNPTALISGSVATAATGAVKRQKLGDLEVEYFDPRSAGASTAAPGTTKGPLLLRTFPWLRDLIGCWVAHSGANQLAYRVRS